MGVTCLLPQNVKHNEFVLTLDHGVNWGCRIPVYLHKENNDFLMCHDETIEAILTVLDLYIETLVGLRMD